MLEAFEFVNWARYKVNASVKRAKAAFLSDKARLLADQCLLRKWSHLAKTLCGLDKV